jgi:hypothetical protein
MNNEIPRKMRLIASGVHPVSAMLFMNSVIAGIFALRGYSFKSRLIYPFVKHE